MMPLYCTGIIQPANGMSRAPSATWRSYNGVNFTSSVSSVKRFPHSVVDASGQHSLAFEHQLVHIHFELHRHRIVPGQTASAKASCRRIDGLQQPFERKIPNRVGSEVLANLFDGHASGNKLFTPG